MHVVWKRPDGYLGASPEDYIAIELDGHSRLWLHRTDRDSYPFRISGGWEEEELTVKLNNLVNLLALPESEWIESLKERFSHSMKDSPERFYDGLCAWLIDLTGHLKGDSWEVEIMGQAIKLTHHRLRELKSRFLGSGP